MQQRDALVLQSAAELGLRLIKNAQRLAIFATKV